MISNLDLSFVVRNYGRILTEREDSRLDPEYSRALAPAPDEPDVPHQHQFESDLFSLSAVEFSRVFPQAWDFRLSTAARMSASFPWVSPSVSLPTTPSRRVVDAGYYDNYGVNLAALWVTKLRHWLIDNASGVLIVQIRDSVSQRARTEIGFEYEYDREDGPLDRLTWRAIPSVLASGLRPLGTPLVGVATAREWSMSFRNDEQVEMFDRLLGDLDPPLDPGFFQTVVFECPVEAATSWTLSEKESRKIRNGLPGGQCVRVEEIDRLDYLRGHSRLLHDADYRARAKRLYDDALKQVDYGPGRDRSFAESRDLYFNLRNNQRRLALLKVWWNGRRRNDRGSGTHRPADPGESATPTAAGDRRLAATHGERT
jgi:hypothetical protein